jgi:hypothetical protein
VELSGKPGSPGEGGLPFRSLPVIYCICYIYYMKALITSIILFSLLISCNITQIPNILLIVSEDNGPDLGCYGIEEVHTPNLDRLADEGLLFQNAFVTYSVCSP